MIQVIVLDTDDKKIYLSRSDEQSYNTPVKYFKELKQLALNKDIKYIDMSFTKLKDLFSNL